jgi:hypothetical protein
MRACSKAVRNFAVQKVVAKAGAMKRLTLVAVAIGCVLAAAIATNTENAAAMDLAQDLRGQNGDARLRLASLVDCSPCQRGGHCPTICAKSRPPKPTPSQSNANTHGCACLHNETGQTVNFRYHWGTREWKTVNMGAGYQYAICWRYADGSRSSPDLQFELDVDRTKGSAWTTYNIKRVQTAGSTCNLVPADAHFTVKFRPNTGNQFIAVYKRKS